VSDARAGRAEAPPRVTILSTLHDRLRDFEISGKLRSPYPGMMWRHALAHPDDAKAFRQGRDSLPYVPFLPESFGLDLLPGSRLLDVGCLAGHGLYDFCRRRAAAGQGTPKVVGVDVDLEATAVGLKMAQTWAPTSAVFCVASAEALPFPDEAFDMVIARLVLPYVSVSAALDELARVLAGDGLALIQPHGPGYYFEELWREACRLRFKAASYFARPLLTLGYFILSGRQAVHPWWKELALNQPTLFRLCRERGLYPAWGRPIRGRPLTLFRKARLQGAS